MGPWGGEHQRCPEGGSVKQGALTLRPEYVKRGAPALRTTEGGREDVAAKLRLRLLPGQPQVRIPII